MWKPGDYKAVGQMFNHLSWWVKVHRLCSQTTAENWAMTKKEDIILTTALLELRGSCLFWLVASN